MSRFAFCLAACLFAVPAFAITTQNPDTESDGEQVNITFLDNCPSARSYYQNLPFTEYIVGNITALTGTAKNLQVKVDGIRIEFPNPDLATTVPPNFTGTYWLAVEPGSIAAIYEGTGAGCKLLVRPSLYTDTSAP